MLITLGECICIGDLREGRQVLRATELPYGYPRWEGELNLLVPPVGSLLQSSYPVGICARAVYVSLNKEITKLRHYIHDETCS